MSNLHDFLAARDAFQPSQSQRLGFLYSYFSFRRESNPTGFAGAVSFWRDLLCAIVLQGLQKGDKEAIGNDHLVLHADDGLIGRLKWADVGRPACLGTVVNELAETKDIVPLEAFLSSPTSIYSTSWPSWLLSTLVGRPLWWTFRQLGLKSEEHVTPEQEWQRGRGDWVMLANVEKASHHVMAALRDLTAVSDRLFTPASFRARFATTALPGASLTELDISILLKFLERDRQVLVVKKDAIKVIDSTEPRTISEADLSILRVVEGISSLQSQVDSLEKRVAGCTRKAESCIRASNKDGARAALKLRGLLTTTFSERVATLENLEAVRLRIDNAATDVAVLSAYEAAAKALKSLTPDRDRVDRAHDQLSEAIADQKEIEEAINAIGADAAVEVDEDELEAELKDLELERKRDDAKADTVPTQPEAGRPTHEEPHTDASAKVEERQSEPSREALLAS